MRKSVWIVALLFFWVIGAPKVQADEYADATFTCDTSCVDVPTDPWVSFPSPTIPVNFFGQTFNMTLNQWDQPGDTYAWGVGSNGSSWDFVITDTTNGKSDTSGWFAYGSYGNPYGSGTVCFAPVPTPEPSSASLLLLGVGILFLAWRIVGHSRLQTA